MSASPFEAHAPLAVPRSRRRRAWPPRARRRASLVVPACRRHSERRWRYYDRRRTRAARGLASAHRGSTSYRATKGWRGTRRLRASEPLARLLGTTRQAARLRCHQRLFDDSRLGNPALVRVDTILHGGQALKRRVNGPFIARPSVWTDAVDASGWRTGGCIATIRAHGYGQFVIARHRVLQ